MTFQLNESRLLQVVVFMVLLLFLYWILGDSFCSLLCLLNCNKKKVTVLWKGASSWSQYVTLIDFNVKKSERGKMTLECITPYILCHIMLYLKFAFLVVKCSFTIKMTFSLELFVLTFTLSLLKRSVILRFTTKRYKQISVVILFCTFKAGTV